MSRKLVPDLEMIKDISLYICKEFVVFAKQYYDTHKEDEMLQKISRSVSMYEDLFRETVYTVLCLKRKTHFYDKAFLKPFVTNLKRKLYEEQCYRDCIKYNKYYATMLDKMIDTAILRMILTEPINKDVIDTRLTELYNELKVEGTVVDGSPEN